LSGINFRERYVNLSRKFAHPAEARTEKVGTDAALKIMAGLGYPAVHHQGDDFFQVTSRGPRFKIHLNVVLKHGIVELIFGVYESEVPVLPVSGPWGVIARDAAHSERLRPPVFRNHEELAHILGEAFSIMEDLKRTLSGVAGPGAKAEEIVERKTPLLHKIDQLLIELNKRQAPSAQFFRAAADELENPLTSGEAIKRLRSCYSMTQYEVFSSAEEQLLEEIISLSRDPAHSPPSPSAPSC